MNAIGMNMHFDVDIRVSAYICQEALPINIVNLQEAMLKLVWVWKRGQGLNCN